LKHTYLFLSLFLLATAGREARAQLEVQPPSIDFGERGQNERPEAVLTLRNGGVAPLKIRELKRSCDCLGLSPQQLSSPIPPGGSATLRVTMSSGRAMGRLDKRITIVTQNPRQPEVVVPVVMRVLDDFEMEPRSISFEGVCGGSPEKQAIEVRPHRGRRPPPITLAIKGIHGVFRRPSEQFLRARVEPSQGGQRIVVELDPRHPEGPISAELEASLNGKSLFVPINGEMFAGIKVSPNYLNFSRVTRDDPGSAVREVVLSSTDSTPFKVLEITPRPYRAGENLVKLEFSVRPGGGPSAPGAPEPPAGGPGGQPAAGAPSTTASTVQKIVCRALPVEEKEATFFGTVTIRTDHPKKPELTLKYSGFFAAPKPAPAKDAQKSPK
jgi:hypothetical protein